MCFIVQTSLLRSTESISILPTALLVVLTIYIADVMKQFKSMKQILNLVFYFRQCPEVLIALFNLRKTSTVISRFFLVCSGVLTPQLRKRASCCSKIILDCVY